MSNDKIKICHLYSRAMNIYGDRGNIIALTRRAQWRGKEVEYTEYNIGDKAPDLAEVDLFFFGGGQDLQQNEVAADLPKIADKLKKQVIEKKAALLAICGGMQLLAKYYETIAGERLEGIGLFDGYTVGGPRRFIGNVQAEAQLVPGQLLVGFENHSGRSYFNWDKQTPLGKVIAGEGNNGEDKTEGVVFHHAVGSYLHGSLLPKNPWLADWLLVKAFERRFGNYRLAELVDEEEAEAAKKAAEIARRGSAVTNITSNDKM
jgi:lipid II isoglutaminyl synthase (glutamine-hydrolysing)